MVACHSSGPVVDLEPANSHSCFRSNWQNLPLDCLERALRKLLFSDVAAVAATCASWRRFVLENQLLLAAAPLSSARPRALKLPTHVASFLPQCAASFGVTSDRHHFREGAPSAESSPEPSLPRGSPCCLLRMAGRERDSSLPLHRAAGAGSAVSRRAEACSGAACVAAAAPGLHQPAETTHSTLQAAQRSASRCLASPAQRGALARRSARLPAILQAAAEAGNLAAVLAGAEFWEGRGEAARAVEMRRRAGRAGHQRSQFLLGEAYYRGEGGCARDSEEALAWLLRAARRREGEGDEEVSAAAALLLGYMYMDGEGTGKVCNTEAVKWLTFARNLGCREAETTLGWMWNTGQY